MYYKWCLIDPFVLNFSHLHLRRRFNFNAVLFSNDKVILSINFAYSFAFIIPALCYLYIFFCGCRPQKQN